jgi:gliding motility-associated-like protein
MKRLLSAFFGLVCFFTFAQDINMQNGTFTRCSGVLFDSGGNSDYSNNENFTLTICPQNAGQTIKLDFTSFYTQSTEDVLTFFDGQTTSDPTIGSYSGTMSPEIIQATSSSGCITLRFISNSVINSNGWAANISCHEPCQIIISQIDSAVPAPNTDGYIRVCPNQQISLTGSGQFGTSGVGASYEWDFGDGTTQNGQTATFSYTTPGVYFVNLNISDTNTSNDPSGCKNSNLINQVVQVSTPIDFMGTAAVEASLFLGESTTITGVANETHFLTLCTPPVSGVTFLPDGNGAVYETSIVVDCFESSQTLDDINHLSEICLEMEHSYLGDLDIDIISPSGQSVRLHNQGGYSANLGIPWATSHVDSQSSILTAGQGFNYCFVANTSLPTLTAGVQSNGTFVAGNGPATYKDSFVSAGEYSSLNPLDGLVGSTLNGSWTIRVTDNHPADNGYIFSWVINFDPSILPSDISFTPAITSEGWDADNTITNTSGNTITVQPPSDGIFCYTYRVMDDFGCEYTKDVCIEVFPELIYANPNDLLICTPTGATSYVFDLTQNDPIIFAPNPNPADFVLTYHTSQAKADADTNPISATDAAAFTGTNGQVIYGRFEYLNSGCYEIVSFILNLFSAPSISSVSDLIFCDDAVDGDDTNGVVEFDLSTKALEVLGTQSSSDYDVKFYYNQAAADAGAVGTDITNSIQNSTNPQNIFARLENKLNNDCFDTTSFQLIVNPLPVVNSEVTLKQCDTDTDGITDFNLTQANQLISSNFVNETFTYYLTQAHAESGLLIDQIPTPTIYTNPTPVNSIVYARSQINHGCFRTSKINLVVGATLLDPVAFQLEYFVCDDTEIDNDNSNGVATFDFSDATAQVLAQLPTNQYLTVSYYISEAAALAETNPIPDISNYRNTTSPNTQKIYVRVDSNDVNACLGLGHHITLKVDPLPERNTIMDYVLCNDTNQTTFDLTSKESELLGSQTPPILISYHLSEQHAIDNIPIPNPSMYQNISNPQTIFVRAQFDPNNNMNLDVRECVRTDMSFKLQVNLNPLLITPDPIVECNDQVTTVYDLTLRQTQITNNDSTIILTYFESQLDLDNNNPIPNPTTYKINTFSNTIFVLATGVNQCTSTVNLELTTVLYPNLNTTPPPLEECEIDNNGFDYYDLTLRESSVLNGLNPSDFEISYYEDEMDALSGNTNNIPDPTNFENTIVLTQEIYLRVKPKLNNCFIIVPLTIIVNPVPEIDILDRYVICLNKDDQVIAHVTQPFLSAPPIDTQLSPTVYSFQWYKGSIEDVHFDPSAYIIPGATSATFSPTIEGIYTVHATNITSGCRIPASTEVVSSYPHESIDVTLLSEIFSDNNKLEVSVVGIGVYEYRVDFSPWQKEALFENIPIGEHIVYVRDLLNCNEITQKKIVIGYPKFFTPYGDGYHDTWNIIGMTVKSSSKIYIFDRYGKLLKEVSSTGKDWDGTFNGVQLPSSDYWFTLEYYDPVTEKMNLFRAHFTLKR